LDAVVDAEAEAFRVAKASMLCAGAVTRQPGEGAVRGTGVGYPARPVHCPQTGHGVAGLQRLSGSGVPSTTILRWIARLEREGLLYRQADTGDLRRRYVRLTQDGLTMMRNILGAIGTF
jgi:hypothetical protein